MLVSISAGCGYNSCDIPSWLSNGHRGLAKVAESLCKAISTIKSDNRVLYPDSITLSEANSTLPARAGLGCSWPSGNSADSSSLFNNDDSRPQNLSVAVTIPVDASTFPLHCNAFASNSSEYTCEDNDPGQMLVLTPTSSSDLGDEIDFYARGEYEAKLGRAENSQVNSPASDAQKWRDASHQLFGD